MIDTILFIAATLLLISIVFLNDDDNGTGF